MSPIAAERLRELYRERAGQLEDFWGRRATGLKSTGQLRAFGHIFDIRASQPVFARAAARVAPLFSQAQRPEAGSGRLEGIVHASGPDPGPAPDDLAHRVAYCGTAADGEVWIGAGAWGWARADLAAGVGRLVVHERLAARPDLLTGCLLNTVVLNLLIGRGLGMLHAGCLVLDGCAVLLLGDHGAGKSTAALDLVRRGFQLLTESMVFVEAGDPTPWLFGFPVGRVKLRQDMARRLLADEPDVEALLETEVVRGETKRVLDLRRWRPGSVYAEALRPNRVALCLLKRRDGPASTLVPAETAEVAEAVFANSLYYDREPAWTVNAEVLGALLDGATCHHLEIGSDPGQLAECVQQTTAGRRE